MNTRAELEAAILAVIPTASFDTDNDGQIIIYTDLMYNGDSVVKYVPGDFLHCDECGQTMMIDSSGVSNHIDDDGNVDHDKDADHVAYTTEAEYK